MPTYEYECASCGKSFDVFQNMSDAPVEKCPTCGSAVKRRINGGTGIIFKGSGFYKNDSKKSTPETKASRTPPSSSTTSEDSSASPKKEAV